MTRKAHDVPNFEPFALTSTGCSCRPCNGSRRAAAVDTRKKKTNNSTVVDSELETGGSSSRCSSAASCNNLVICIIDQIERPHLPHGHKVAAKKTRPMSMETYLCVVCAIFGLHDAALILGPFVSRQQRRRSMDACDWRRGLVSD